MGICYLSLMLSNCDQRELTNGWILKVEMGIQNILLQIHFLPVATDLMGKII